MDKKEAIQYLRERLSEIPKLARLPFNNDEYPLWRDTIAGILEEVFGRDSSEYQKFSKTYRVPKSNKQKHYITVLKKRETDLLSIIRKHEILGVEAEPPKVPEDYEEKAAIEGLELILEGTPDMIIECIRSTAEKLNSQGCMYSFRRTSGRPDYATWDKTNFASYAISQGNEGQIGTIELRLLPKERTSFKFLEPKNWGLSFGRFLNHLFIEFQRLGFIYFEEEKPPLGFKPPHREENV